MSEGDAKDKEDKGKDREWNKKERKYRVKNVWTKKIPWLNSLKSFLNQIEKYTENLIII